MDKDMFLYCQCAVHRRNLPGIGQAFKAGGAGIPKPPGRVQELKGRIPRESLEF